MTDHYRTMIDKLRLIISTAQDALEELDRERPQRPAPPVVEPVRGRTRPLNRPTVDGGLLATGGGSDVRVELLEDGYARCTIERSDFGDPGTAHPAALAQVEKWKAKGSGFESIDGVEFYGPKNANEGGGAGIYPHIAWWAGSPLGLELALRAAVGWCNRQPMWHLDESGDPTGHADPFRRLDRTRTFGRDGKKLERLHGKFDALNSNHLGRLGHLLYFLAKQGNAFGRLALRVLADEVALGWSRPGDLVLLSTPAAYSYFTCREILERYPGGQGCHLMGRGFGHDLTILANAEEIYPGRYADDLEMIEQTLLHVWDEECAAVLAIPALDPIWGQPINAYQKKLNIDQERIPPGEFPRIQRTFEEVLVHHGVERLNAVTGRAASIALGMRMALQRHGGSILSRIRIGSSQLRVLGHPDWSDPREALATRNMLGIPGDPWNKSKTAEQLITTTLPCADHPLNSWAPILWES